MTKFKLEHSYGEAKVTMEFEDETLPDILQRIVSFLNAAGYTYVRELEAINDSDVVDSDIENLKEELADAKLDNEELLSDYEKLLEKYNELDKQFSKVVKAEASNYDV